MSESGRGRLRWLAERDVSFPLTLRLVQGIGEKREKEGQHSGYPQHMYPRTATDVTLLPHFRCAPSAAPYPGCRLMYPTTLNPAHAPLMPLVVGSAKRPPGTGVLDREALTPGEGAKTASIEELTWYPVDMTREEGSGSFGTGVDTGCDHTGAAVRLARRAASRVGSAVRKRGSTGAEARRGGRGWFSRYCFLVCSPVFFLARERRERETGAGASVGSQQRISVRTHAPMLPGSAKNRPSSGLLLPAMHRFWEMKSPGAKPCSTCTTA